jgi:hypothetical protein
METRTAKCPYDGIAYNKIPRYKSGYDCPYCKAIGPNHIEVERTFLTNEEAEEILKKYVKKHWVNRNAGDTYNAGREILEYAWYSQHWPTYALYSDDYLAKHCDKKDWMEDDLKLAFEWYLDGVGRDLGYGNGYAEGAFEKGYDKKLEKELTEMARKLSQEKYNKECEARERRDQKMKEEGKALVDSLNIGDVVMVKFDRSWWPTRPLQIMEIENGFVAGFYLDPVDQRVIADTPEKEGYRYTKPSKYISVNVGDNKWVDGKLEWDGKTMKKTRSYVSKDIKFVKEKIENPVIVK